MAAFDIELACFNAVAAMSSNAGVMAVVKPNCFLFQTNADQRAKKAIMGAPADYPQVRLESTGFRIGQNAPKTFLMMHSWYSSSYGDFGTPFSMTILMTIVHERAQLGSQTPVEKAIRKYLESIWPTLGVVDSAGRNCVDGFAVTGNRKDESSEITGEVLRAVTRANIAITGRARLSQLVA